MAATFAYLIIVLVLIPICGFLGYLAHLWKAQFFGKLADGDDLASDLINQTLADRDYMFEKYVIGAKWDENGFWDEYSTRNILYYVISSALLPLVMGAVLWPARFAIVAQICSATAKIGLHPLFCS